MRILCLDNHCRSSHKDNAALDVSQPSQRIRWVWGTDKRTLFSHADSQMPAGSCDQLEEGYVDNEE